METSDTLVITLLHQLDDITVADRIRQATELRVQERIDGELIARVGRFAEAPRHQLSARIAELENEWDIERVLTLQSSITALVGLAAGARRRGWLALTAVTSGFLLQHSLQGWCPPLALHRRLGFRTRREIDLELNMLKVLRGDFERVPYTEPAHDPAAG